MNENIELLEYIYKDANIAIESMTTLLKTIKSKDNKIKNAVEDVLKDYEQFLKETKKLFQKHKVKPKEENMMAKAGAWMGIKMDLMKDNSDSRVADMLIKGLTMGNIDVTRKLDNYEGETSSEILKIAKEFKNFQKKTIDKLKKYL